MAGDLGATDLIPAFRRNFPLFNSHYPTFKSFKSLLSIYNYNFYPQHPHRKIRSFALEMAQSGENQRPEVEEPTPKIPKLEQNGVSEAPHKITSFLRVKKLSEKAILPSRASPLLAGYDFSNATETKVPARGKALIPTDISIAIPEGTYARIAPRSGLAWKHSIDVGAGVIDADYRGPVAVILFNHSDVDFEVKTSDRIAQLIIEKIITPEVTEVDDLDSTNRGLGGFGSTDFSKNGRRQIVCRIREESSPPMTSPTCHPIGLSEAAAAALKNCVPFLNVRRLSDKATLPKRMFPYAAGYDLFSAMDAKVPARGKAKISTDLIIDIPQGAYGRIAGRSSLAWGHSIDVGGGVVDADQNPIFVILYNHSDVDFEVKVGDRIAQMVIELNATPEIREVHQ